MIQQLSKWILYKRLGWTKEITIAHPEKYIICLAPHTSNWDLLIGQLYAHAEGIKSNFLMKKEWFFWPLGPSSQDGRNTGMAKQAHQHDRQPG